MGWFWSTAPVSPAQKPPGQQPPPATAPAPPPTQTPASEFENDPEIQKFLGLFQEDIRGNQTKPHEPPHLPTPSSPPNAPAANTPSWLSWRPSAASSSTPSPAAPDPSTTAPPAPDTPAAALATSLLPTTMSCRQAFDLAWGCQGPVGQLGSVYRYGTARSCSQLWDDYWFCMRTRGMSSPHREEAIRAHYRAKEARKYYAPGARSSEDVWRGRDEKVPPGGAFTMRYEAPDESDEEQMAAQMERRRRIREELGYEAKTTTSAGH